MSNVTDASFVIEILERVEPDDPSEAAKSALLRTLFGNPHI